MIQYINALYINIIDDLYEIIIRKKTIVPYQLYLLKMACILEISF